MCQASVFCLLNTYWALEWTLRSNGNGWLELETGGQVQQKNKGNFSEEIEVGGKSECRKEEDK